MIINRLKFLLFTCLFTGFGLIIPAASLLAQEPHPDAASTTMVAEEWKIENMIFEHINNSNEFHIVGHIAIPLPCILYSREDGLTTFMSSALEHGHKAINRYVLVEGVVWLYARQCETPSNY